jgi:hypothetical protein
MKIPAVLTFALLLNLSPGPVPAQDQSALPKSHAETSNYEETSRYDDVQKFFQELHKRTPLMHLDTFGKTVEGRELPLVILADPPITNPTEAKASGKPVVFIMANIHAGEVEGKEAVQALSRRIVAGDLKPLLSKIVILIAPIYNADGNEKISLQNRRDQYGPIAGVGVRENSQGYDLNRDYVKLDAPEARALVKLFNDWDPHLTVDLHTTDGSYHAYHLTFSIPLNPTIDPEIYKYHREKMMPEIQKTLLADYKYRGYYYGNFNQTFSSANRAGGGATNTRAWYAFSPQPRVGQNYLGFRNRLTILSEAYSHLDFKARIDVTAAFVEEIFKFAAAHADEILKLTAAADARTVERGLHGPPFQVGAEFVPAPLPEPVEILVGDVKRVSNPRLGTTNMVAMVDDVIKPEKMIDYGLFDVKRTVPAARAYVFRADPKMQMVIEKLRAHGIVVEELTAPLSGEVERFTVGEATKSPRAFQSHNEVKLAGKYEKVTMDFPSGSIIVRTAQPLGILAACLLEPESDDGLVTWNFLDPVIEIGQPFPIYKLNGDFKAVSSPLK